MRSYDTGPQESSAGHAESAPVTGQQVQEESRESERKAGAIGVEEQEYAAAPSPSYAQAPLEQPRSRRFTPPSRAQLLSWAPFWGVILLGALLRFWGLGDKPLHHDESLHAYFSWQLMTHNLDNWLSCFSPQTGCYTYDPLLHGPFQFHIIAITYQISRWLGAPDHGINTTTVRIPAAVLGTVIVGLPYFLRDYLGRWGAWLASLLLAVSPSMVYFSRFAREDVYMACFTLLLVIGIVRYVQERKMRWLLLAAAAFALSYATSEATFLTIAIFGGFLGGLLAWELGLSWRLDAGGARPWYMPRSAAPLFLLAYMIFAGVVAKIGLSIINWISVYATNAQTQPSANAFVQNLKNVTVFAVPWLGIALGIFVLAILWREQSGRLPRSGRHGVAHRVDPRSQRMFDTLLTLPWTHCFFAILLAWSIFLVLFTALFTNIRGGIGDGIWQGLYYWIQQQQVARGAQPWYYYLLLIPLYEQIGVVFGLVGLLRCLVRPTRLRIFLAYWFVGTLFLYSWAGEKMPWLVIFMTMPMLLLAGIGLEPCVVTLLKQFRHHDHAAPAGVPDTSASEAPQAAPARPRRKNTALAAATSLSGLVLAVVLLLPTLQNMYEVSYVHAADGPHEMMVYVQTTSDVNSVMARIDALDQRLYQGKHLLPIGIMNDATWPFAWYVRDYPNICFNYPSGCSASAKSYPVVIAGGDNLYTAEAQYGSAKGGYLYHVYKMRTWWDEGYKPPPCVPSSTKTCSSQQQAIDTGVGLGLWLSYGDNPPPTAGFNPGLAAQHIWNWWWYRTPIGSTDGAYDMGLFVQRGAGVYP